MKHHSFVAHKVESPEDRGLREHLLAEHLSAVSQKAAEFAREARPGDEAFAEAAKWAGLLHDLGKYSPEFQSYLRGARERGPETHHAVFGAVCAFKQEACGPAFAVAGHHAGIHDRHELQSFVEDPKYAIPDRLPAILQAFEQEMGRLPARISEPSFAVNALSVEFYTRMLFSCLVDADFLDTEEFFAGGTRRVVRLSEVREALIERLTRERDSKPRQGKVNEIRHAIFDRCLTQSHKTPGFYTLSVPTGGGKTLSSMAFAMSHAREHGLRRVIVVIPYLSIIEQNAAEYRRILDPGSDGLVIEDHSGVPVAADREGRRRSATELASDNWDAPVVVTTSVQFIESLFANTNSRCRKLHNIARSVVILDEVQTLPMHLLTPLLSVLRELKENYGITLVFCTATQPAFRQGPNLNEGFRPGELIEIAGESAAEVAAPFRALQRVEYKMEGCLDWKMLAERMVSSPQSLCVLNVRRHAFELWEALRNAVPEEDRDSIFHLSSAMCAEHRLHVLGTIKDPREGSIRYRLKAGLPCRLVSTQVVEAGVDIDFPMVLRAMGPLDSIVQVAGRCNREGRLKDPHGYPQLGKVVLFTPSDPVVPPGIYKTATGHATAFLEQTPLDSLDTDPFLFGRYFSGLFQLASTDHARKRESTVQEDRAELRFREVARKAKVIEDDGRPVVVPYSKGKEEIEWIRNRSRTTGEPRFYRHDLRALQRYMVSVRHRDFIKLEAARAVTPLLPNLELFVLDAGWYHEYLGLLIDQRPTEDLCGV